MSGLIGGSGSTGSSLLRQILNRHSQIFCGPESSLFCKPDLYENWSVKKGNITSRGITGLRNKSWLVYRGTDLLKEEFGISAFEMDKMIFKSDTFEEFANLFYASILLKSNKKYWLEKTPANAYSFSAFLKHFQDGKVIHLYRNPYDTIASLLKRGFSHFEAVSIYLLNTTFALSSSTESRYYQLSYEHLVSQPQKTIEQTCDFLGVDFESQMIQGTSKKYADDPTRLEGWTYDESQKIGVKSIGNFEKLPTKDQALIHSGIRHIEIKKEFAIDNNLQFTNITSLAEHLGYNIITDSNKLNGKNIIASQRRKDLYRRTRKWSYFNVLNNPIQLR